MSVPDKQNSCCGDGDGTVHCLQVMTMCRTVPTAAECPPVVVLGERVGRGQGEPDGGAAFLARGDLDAFLPNRYISNRPYRVSLVPGMDDLKGESSQYGPRKCHLRTALRPSATARQRGLDMLELCGL